MALADELERTAAAAGAMADGRRWPAVLPAEPAAGAQLPLRVRGCRRRQDLARGGRRRRAVRDRREVRDAVSIAALCEVAEEAAFPGDLDELRAQLVALRITEAPEGIEEAEEAAPALQHVIGAPPQLAAPHGSTRSARPRGGWSARSTPPRPRPSPRRCGAQSRSRTLVADVEAAYRAAR